VITAGAQPLINAHDLQIKTACGGVSCLVTASVTLTLPNGHGTWHLQGTATTIAAGRKGAVLVPVPASLRRAVRAYLRHHPHYRPKITVTVSVLSGGYVTQTVTETLPVWTLRGFR
jgi:hypothetical protein